MSYEFITLAGQIGGTYMQVQGARQQAKAEEAMHKANAQMALQEAAYLERASLEKQRIMRAEARRRIKSLRVAMAKSGAGMGGSNLLILLESAANMSKDIALFAWEQGIGIQRKHLQARIDLSRASAARRAGRLKVTQAIMSGAGQTVSYSQRYEQTTGESLFTAKALFS